MVTLTLILPFLLVFHPGSGDVDLQNIEIPDVDIDDFAVIKDKCDKAGGAGTYDRLKESKESFQTCVTQFANATVVKNEVEEAKKTGSMDEVFGKYCKKRPKLAACVESFTGSLRGCLNEEENKALNVTLDVLKQLGDFVCYRDGDRIAMFIAEGGVECIQSRTEGIKDCVNSTFKIEPATVNTNALPTLLMDKKKCDDIGKLQNCVVEELEKCEQSTPANIVDALFKFIKKQACGKKNKRSIQIHSIVKRSLAGNLYNPTGLKDHYMKIFKEKCEKNAPDGGYEEFTLNFESASHCVRNKTKQDKFIIVPAATFKGNIEKCVRKLIEKTEACLPDDEKYWPTFYLEMIENIIDFIYANKDTILNLKRVELMYCSENFQEKEARNEVMKCFQVPDVDSLKKEVLCGKLTLITSCLSQQIKKRCIPDVTLNKLWEGYARAATAPCSKYGL